MQNNININNNYNYNNKTLRGLCLLDTPPSHGPKHTYRNSDKLGLCPIIIIIMIITKRLISEKHDLQWENQQVT